MSVRKLFLLGAMACCAGLALPVEAGEWMTTWAAAPLPAVAAGPMPAPPSFNNQTIRQVVRVSAGGPRLRVRFTNEYGTKPLRIGSARVALNGADGQPGVAHSLTFAGQASIILPAGAPFLSDPLDLAVPSLASLTLIIYLPEDTGSCTCHSPSLQTAYVSAAGDFTADPRAVAGQKIQVRAFLSAVEVEAGGRGAGVIAILGDSISDGVGSTVDANRRWPDLLANRLAANGQARGIANLSISGNQILVDGNGQSALARFDRDVLSVSSISHLIVFLGINDLGFGLGRATGAASAVRSPAPASRPTAESLIAAYRQLIVRAHARNIKVIAATMTPYEGAQYFSEEGEAVRLGVNRWIRNSREFDAVLDFDSVLRDPANPGRVAEGLHAGDHLHGNDLAYARLAESVDLTLFK